MNIYRIGYECISYGELGYSDISKSFAYIVAETEEAAELIYPAPQAWPESTLTVTVKLIGTAVEGIKVGILR